MGWSNGERALAPYFYHYAATGLRRFLDMGRAMVHHTIGIDTGHKGGDSRHGGYHRHNQVHWRHNPGGTRQGGFRGWHNYYWMTGDPEVGRLALLEGIDAPANALTLNLKQPKGTWRIGQSYFSAVSSFLAHQCWITSGNWRYARAHRPIMKMYKDSGEKEQPVLSKWHFYKVVNGEPEGYQLGTNKGPISGYFLTYGGDDLMVEWASLTGDPIAVDAILLQGRLHGKHYANKRMATYHSPEYLYLAMAFLEPDNTDLPKLLENRLWHNQPGLKNFKNKGLKAPKEYKAATDWTRFNTYIYKKNGFSIHGAQCLEMIHLMRAMELIGKNP